MTAMNIHEEAGFQAAVRWTRAQLQRLSNGGVWAIPRSQVFIRVVSHERLEADVIGAEREEGVIDIMRSLGWKITKITGV